MIDQNKSKILVVEDEQDIRDNDNDLFQKVKNLPINKHDQKLDCIITEKKIIK